MENKFTDIIEYADYKNLGTLLRNGSGDPREFINPLPRFLPTKEQVPNFNTDEFNETFFKGGIVKTPYFINNPIGSSKYKRFEDFTITDEVNHIALWMLAALKDFSGKNISVGKELEVEQRDNPRDGRLDVVALQDTRLLVIETKTDLRTMLTENRFESQISAYKKESDRLSNANDNISNNLVILGIGGKETDLYPSSNSACTTGKVGDISDLFYRKIENGNINFISANGMWSIITYAVVNSKSVNLFDTIFDLLSQSDVMGIISGGVVRKVNGSVVVEEVDLDTL